MGKNGEGNGAVKTAVVLVPVLVGLIYFGVQLGRVQEAVDTLKADVAWLKDHLN